MWPDLPLPIIYAHRGDSVHAPENTLAAFKSAIKCGASAVEFDVKLSADDQVIIIHDQTVNRTTNGSGNIRNLSLSEIKKIDAGGYFSEQFRGEKIPTLEEAFQEVGEQLFMNIELTNYVTPGDNLVEKVAGLIRKYNMEKRVVFSSFYPINLKKAFSYFPDIPRSLLTWAGWLGWWGRKLGYRRSLYQGVNPAFEDVNSQMIDRAHHLGRRIQPYTVDDPVEIIKLVKLGVDGIFTNDPELAMKSIGHLNI